MKLQPRQSPTHGLLGLALTAVSVTALAGDDCDVPVERWQSREAVRQMALQRGWEVQRLKIDDGCYEIRGRDAEGRAFKATIDPETLTPVRIKVRDRDAQPPVAPGSKPRGQIE